MKYTSLLHTHTHTHTLSPIYIWCSSICFLLCLYTWQQLIFQYVSPPPLSLHLTIQLMFSVCASSSSLYTWLQLIFSVCASSSPSTPDYSWCSIMYLFLLCLYTWLQLMFSVCASSSPLYTWLQLMFQYVSLPSLSLHRTTVALQYVSVVVYPLPWPLLVGGVRCSRLWSTSQLLRPPGQQCSHSDEVCLQIQGWQCGAYVGAVEEMMCVVCLDVTERA